MKSEDFIGWKSEDGKLEVIGVAGKKGRTSLFKVTCTECSKDKELFPEGYFISLKSCLLKGQKPCGCSKKPEWKDWQYLVIIKRIGDIKGFIVKGYVENFYGQHTKVKLKCLKDNHEWESSLNNIINTKRGCPVCGKSLRLTEEVVLSRCQDRCLELGYTLLGFPDNYKNQKSSFEYICPIHGKRKVVYSNFIYNESSCLLCSKEQQKQKGLVNNGNGYYPERKDEQDILYILNFNDQFIKVGRSFDIERRIKELQKESGIQEVQKLRIFTATHQEIYSLEQEIHNILRKLNFQYPQCWSTECFNKDCLVLIYNLIDKAATS